MKKILAALLALSMVLVFTACKDKTEDETTTTTTTEATANNDTTGTADPTATDTTASTDPTATDTTGSTDPTATDTSAPTSGSESEPTATTPPPVGGTSVDLSSKDKIIEAYNKGLQNISIQRTSYKRTLTKGSAVAKVIGLQLIDDQNLHNNDEVKKRANVDEKANKASDLVQLTGSQVKSATSSVSGNTATLTITLNNTSPASPQSGTDGYVGILDNATTKNLIVSIATELSSGLPAGIKLVSVDITEMNMGLSDGKYIVTMDTATGKIKTVTFTGNQGGDAKASCKAKAGLTVTVPATAELVVAYNATYSA